MRNSVNLATGLPNFKMVRRLGAGQNHFLLPRCTGAINSNVDVIFHGDYSMEVLVNALLNKGAKKGRLIAKAFGGGAIVSHIKAEIGERNSMFAREWLDREGIPLISSDFNGPWSRKIVFVPQTGEAYCSRLAAKGANVAEISKAEQALERTVNNQLRKSINNIELF